MSILQLTSLQSKALCIILQHDVLLIVTGCWTPFTNSSIKEQCQPFVTTYSKYSPVANTCVHKSVSSHISLRMPCVYVLACILRMFLGIGGHNSVRHRKASDIGTAVFLTMDPKLGQTTSKLINSLLSSKQPCMLETKMMQDMRFSTQCTKESTVPERLAVSLGKQLSEASQCFYLQAQALLPGLFNT